MYTEDDKKLLLQIARSAIECKLEDINFAKPEIKSTILDENAGVFVTLHKKSNLRGCIGTFFADKPLFLQVKRMAEAAAFDDSRFSPVRKKELSDIDIEISILSPLQQTDHIEEIEIGKHGIFITKGFNRGVLLPQVAVEHGWDRETFLCHTCMKAGLSPHAWKEGATIEIFSAHIFGEKDLL